MTGTAGTPIVQAPVVSFTVGDGSTPPGSYTAVINRGDGTGNSTGTVTGNNGVCLVSGDHTYDRAGTSPVAVVITRAGAPALAANTAATIALAASPAQAFRSSIAGRVYLDATRNGRDDANEFGIATVVVTLTGTTAAGRAVSQTTPTDDSGNYSFDGLGAGTYQVIVSRPTAYFHKGAVTVGSAGGLVSGESVASIKLGAGDSATDYDFAELNRANCRLSSAAVRAILRVGPNGTLPASSRPSSLNPTGPLAPKPQVAHRGQ